MTRFLTKAYYLFREFTAPPEEKGSYSAGWWPYKIRMETIRLLSKKKGLLLDIGCGEGLMLSKFIKNKVNLKTIVIDNSCRSLLKAKGRIEKYNRPEIIFLMSDANKLCFKPNSFDVCICLNFFLALSSEKEAEDIFTEISKVLKPKGKLIFDIRNSKNMLLHLKYKLARFYDVTIVNQPLRMDSPLKIRQMLLLSGFKINQEIGIGFFVKDFCPAILIEAEKI